MTPEIVDLKKIFYARNLKTRYACRKKAQKTKKFVFYKNVIAKTVRTEIHILTLKVSISSLEFCFFP